ncbi:hypothetical protein COL65_02385 [Priestia aryabhattai]|uniref:hypothetical protein n=1 Tax=Priestia aryabhattai TaxID=412384 RepID=UPI000BF942A0|nr:hypothetical protein [Priestia aryabhattai]PGA21957.1 hypothetical protein COL65_02385 [Priestia aryabhattai]
MNVVKNYDEVVAEILEKKEICYSFNHGIAYTMISEGIASLIKNGIAPVEFRMDGFHFKLKQDDEMTVYQARNEENYVATIYYKKDEKEFEIEMLPDYEDLDSILKHRLEPQKHVTSFQIK